MIRLGKKSVLSVKSSFVSIILPTEPAPCNGSFRHMNHALYICVHAYYVHAVSDKAILEKIDSFLFVILFMEKLVLCSVFLKLLV